MTEPTHRFQFTGKGGELFGIYIVNMILTVVTLGIYSFWARVKIQKYLYQNTALMNEPLDYHATGKELFIGFLKGALVVIGAVIALSLFGYLLGLLIGPEYALLVQHVLQVVLVLAVIPYLIAGSMRFLLARTSWRNLRCNFAVSVADLQKDFYIGLLLTIVTLGIYGPWYAVKMEKYYINNSRYGNQPFAFNGDGAELF